MTTGLNSLDSASYKLTAISDVYDLNNSLTSSYRTAFYPPSGVVGNSNWDYGLMLSTYGFDYINNSNPPMDEYRHALYKLTAFYHYMDNYGNLITNERKSVYLDFRDTRYTNNYSSIDIWIKYDFLTDRFLISSEGPISENDAKWNIISNYSYNAIWNIKNQGKPITSDFQNFWSNCLVLTNDEKNHPQLVWGAYPTYENDVSNYKIYKSKNSVNYSLLATVNSNTFEYIDYSELLYNGSGFPDRVKYYVKAVFDNNQYSEASNIVTTKVSQPINKEYTLPPAA